MRIRSNVKDVEAALDDLATHRLPTILSQAINDTGKTVHLANKRAMAKAFSNPRPYTLNAFYWRFANRNRLEGSLQRKDMIGRRHYLEVQETGGPRPHTGLERLLGARYPGVGYATPARRAPLDRWGGLSGGVIQRLLSQLQAQRDPAANQTEASKARKGRSRPAYFVPRPGQLSPGVWQRKGKSLVRVLTFNVKAPTYRPRFKFHERAEQVAARFLPRRLEAAIARALAPRSPRR